ncbi:hypothetical protein [Dehalobacterium formicoaceticum]|uniref:DUF2953 domain-containing protein n=1 Tax=Dehalobacterium formicoaceticum TaxID=51515 RepID=A0ABT1Y5B0_9FIRM|nr:hypothetical protein [Dehalobacterium formicoaceticum]MCR6546064.1 hypothetical protein [Dehalobacterium formicoaceticum]
MIVLNILAGAVLVVFALFFIIILTPIRYDLRGFWQDKFSGEMNIGAGPFQISFTWAAGGRNIFGLQLAGITLFKKPLASSEKKKEETKPEKKRQKGRWGDVFGIFDRGFIKAILKTVRDIFRHSAPKVMKLEGVWGFDDPYYTGILAAFRSTVPGIHVEPDFTGGVRDLRALVQGRIRPAVVLFYGLRFIVAPPARPVLKKMLQKRRGKE